MPVAAGVVGYFCKPAFIAGVDVGAKIIANYAKPPQSKAPCTSYRGLCIILLN